MYTWKLGKLQKKYTKKLTNSKIIISKSDACLKYLLKIRTPFLQNLTRCIPSKLKSDT